MTGSLQIKSGRFYMVLNSAENGKRKQRWISTGLPVKGNERKKGKALYPLRYKAFGVESSDNPDIFSKESE